MHNSFNQIFVLIDGYCFFLECLLKVPKSLSLTFLRIPVQCTVYIHVVGSQEPFQFLVSTILQLKNTISEQKALNSVMFNSQVKFCSSLEICLETPVKFSVIFFKHTVSSCIGDLIFGPPVHTEEINCITYKKDNAAFLHIDEREFTGYLYKKLSVEGIQQ